MAGLKRRVKSECRSPLTMDALVLALVAFGLAVALGSGPAPPPLYMERSGGAPSSESAALLSLKGVIVLAPGSQGEILAPSTGRILYATDPPKSIGDPVKAGEALCVLEQHYNYHDYAHLYTERWPLQKEFLATKRMMVEAEIANDRARHLYGIGAGSLQEAQRAEGRYKEARAQFDGARRRLEQHDTQIAKSSLIRKPLLSPISGIILDAKFHQGQLVYEGDRIYTIVNLSKIWIKAQVFETDLPRVLQTRSARLRAAAYPDQIFEAHFARVAPRVEEGARTLDVFYEASNRGNQLKIGMVVNLFPAVPESVRR